jgi:hypothetical protein
MKCEVTPLAPLETIKRERRDGMSGPDTLKDVFHLSTVQATSPGETVSNAAQIFPCLTARTTDM